MRVVVVGTGYVGLVTGVCLSAKGHDVTCVDVNADIVDKLNKGQPTIFENGLPDMLSKVCASGGFRASLNLRESLRAADIVLIAVGTPSKDGVIDLQYVKRAAREIGEYIRDSDVYLSVVVKSTVVPGTTDTVVREEIEAASGKRLGDFGLGMNPEFLREGD
jgi:UDPglucose 6-dehydrogenase